MQKMTTVFVVEDSALVRRRIAESIEAAAGCEVVGVAESEDQAFAAIERLRPAIIVADIQLKQGSGMGVLQRVRAQGNSPRPYIIMLSNYAASDYKEHAMAGGADAVFDKTSEYAEFLRVLENRATAGVTGPATGAS